MLEAFANAFLVAPPTVLGVRLRPFSIGHAYILEATESPFFRIGDKPPELWEFCVAVQVCSRTFRDALDFCLTGAGVDRDKWAESCAGYDMAEEALKLARYMASYHTSPEKWKTHGDKPPRAPWMIQLAAAVVGHGPLCGQTLDDALNMPLSEALVLSAARSAYMGDESLITEEEKKSVELLKQLEAANVTS